MKTLKNIPLPEASSLPLKIGRLTQREMSSTPNMDFQAQFMLVSGRLVIKLESYTRELRKFVKKMDEITSDPETY